MSDQGWQAGNGERHAGGQVQQGPVGAPWPPCGSGRPAARWRARPTSSSGVVTVTSLRAQKKGHKKEKKKEEEEEEKGRDNTGLKRARMRIKEERRWHTGT